MKYLLAILLIVLFGSAFAQDKFEQETRIDAQDVPKKAVQFIFSYSSSSKFKWYKEISSRGTSYEAKGKVNGYWYSVEFNKQGEFEDIEVKIKFKEIDRDVQSNILQHLESNYKKHKLVKIQKQYTGKIKSIQPVVEQDIEGLTIQYEIVLFGTEQEYSQQYEMTFSEQGAHLKTAVITYKNLDIIEY